MILFQLKKTLLVVFLAAVVPSSLFATVVVNCKGKKCGGLGGPPDDQKYDYAYEVIVTGDTKFDWFRVGVLTDDISNIKALNKYSGNLAGWSFSDPTEYGHESTDPFTKHNSTNSSPPAPLWSTNKVVRWSRDYGSDVGAGTYWFVFNSDHDPIDVGFLVEVDDQPVLTEDWSKPVGMGLGPVHGPVPEPGSLVLLGLGGLGVLRRRKRM